MSLIQAIKKNDCIVKMRPAGAGETVKYFCISTNNGNKFLQIEKNFDKIFPLIYINKNEVYSEIALR
jgi:hypothetical protein